MSEMFTTCPACRSNLAVTAADLRIGQGYVRCGRCDRVFNALMTLSEDLEDEDQSGLVATGTTTMPVLDDPGEEMEVEELAEELEDDEAETSTPAEYQVDLVESQATGTFETIVLEGDGYLQTEEHVDERIINAQLQEMARQMDEGAAEPEQHPDQEIVLETPDEDAEDDFDADAAVGNRRRHHWVWWLAAAFLGLALAAQLLHHERQTLVAQPWLERPVKAFYGMFGVAVEPRWEVKALEIRRIGGDVLADASDSFQVLATVHNGANFSQPPPVIRVQLTDTYSNVLATLDIPPVEYLISAAPARMAPDQRLDASFRVKDPTGKTAGFTLDVCLSGSDGRLHCHNDL